VEHVAERVKAQARDHPWSPSPGLNIPVTHSTRPAPIGFRQQYERLESCWFFSRSGQLQSRTESSQIDLGVVCLFLNRAPSPVVLAGIKLGGDSNRW
jgi:hypothetical protein